MDLEVTTSKIDGKIKLNFNGTVDISNYKTISTVIEKLLGENERHFILDLGNLTYIDSSGLGALISSYKAVTTHEGTFKIVNLNDNIAKVFQLTRLNVFFHIE